MKKVLVALSGGVDSAVAALLLKRQGYHVAAAYMKNWINEENIAAHCPWMEDIDDARAVCEHLGIEFQVVNFIRDYRERVVSYLVDGYRRGLTPNPDVMCNREMKFGVFLEYALSRGFDAVATGHYCRAAAMQKAERRTQNPEVSTELDGRTRTDGRTNNGESLHANPGSGSSFCVLRSAFCVLEGVDKNKDQSYFLALVPGEQLQRAMFPIGHLTKPQVRQIAIEAGLPNARKKDSQGICFIGQVRINDFLQHYIPDAPGDIVNAAGKVLGQHKGLHRYTLGQRRGIGVPSNTDDRHYVVVGKDADTNRLLVAFEDEHADGLYQDSMLLRNLNWINETIDAPRDILARPRYRDPAVPARFEPSEGGLARITFASPQRALAPGQVCALHDGERLLGGGIFV